MISKIIIPLDGSELAEQALEPALKLAQTLPAQLVLLRITPPGYLAQDVPTVALLREEVERLARAEAEHYLKMVQEKIAAPAETAVVVSQNIPEAILHFAEVQKASLICICSHGRSGLARWRYGSVAEHLLQTTVCPILIIPAQGTAHVTVS